MKVLELGFNFNIMINTQLSHKALVLAPENMHISLMNTDETVLSCTEPERHPRIGKDLATCSAARGLVHVSLSASRPSLTRKR